LGRSNPGAALSLFGLGAGLGLPARAVQPAQSWNLILVNDKNQIPGLQQVSPRALIKKLI
jgi:hypothetical protein